MTDFMMLLAVHYTCSSLSQVQVLQQQQVRQCSVAYETLKTHFLTAEEKAQLEDTPLMARGALSQLSYQRFKEWEASDPDTVARAKSMIMTTKGGTLH